MFYRTATKKNAVREIEQLLNAWLSNFNCKTTILFSFFVHFIYQRDISRKCQINWELAYLFCRAAKNIFVEISIARVWVEYLRIYIWIFFICSLLIKLMKASNNEYILTSKYLQMNFLKTGKYIEFEIRH